MNPYLLMALGIAWALSVLGADHFGYTRAENAAKAHQADAINRAIVEYDAIAEQDKQQSIANARRDALARTAANSIRTKANDVIAAKPLPDSCDWNPDSFGLLVAAVNGANDNPATPDRLPDAVRASNRAGKPAR